MVSEPYSLPPFLEVGFIEKPHGLKGWLFYRPYSGDLSWYREGLPFLIRLRSGEEKEMILAGIREFKNSALILLKGVENRLQGEVFRGGKVFLLRDYLPPLKEGEVYLEDLLGLSCVLPSGDIAGVVESFVEGGPMISLYVKGKFPGYIPYHKEWVGDPDFTKKILPIFRKPIL